MPSTRVEAHESFNFILKGYANASFLVETLDREHGDAVAAWQKMGKPETPNPAQTKALREAAWNTKKGDHSSRQTRPLDFRQPVDARSLVLLKQF